MTLPVMNQLNVRQTPKPDYPNVTNDIIESSSMSVSFTFD